MRILYKDGEEFKEIEIGDQLAIVLLEDEENDEFYKITIADNDVIVEEIDANGDTLSEAYHDIDALAHANGRCWSCGYCVSADESCHGLCEDCADDQGNEEFCLDDDEDDD